VISQVAPRIELASIGCTLKLADVYEQVTFGETPKET